MQVLTNLTRGTPPVHVGVCEHTPAEYNLRILPNRHLGKSKIMGVKALAIRRKKFRFPNPQLVENGKISAWQIPIGGIHEGGVFGD